MSDHLRNFRAWYSDILRDLRANENAGPAMLMIASPLLERYLREKSRAQDGDHLPELFFQELRKIFPVLSDTSMARNFWSALRTDLVTHSAAPANTDRLNPAAIDKAEALAVDPATGAFVLSPVRLVGKIIETIEADFETFERGNNSAESAPRAQVLNSQAGAGASGLRPSTGSDGQMRIMYRTTGPSAANAWRIPYPKEIGILFVVLAVLTGLVAHVGLNLPVMMETTHVFEAPTETINYDSTAVHWIFIVESILFLLGLGLVSYGWLRRPHMAATSAFNGLRPTKRTY